MALQIRQTEEDLEKPNQTGLVIRKTNNTKSNNEAKVTPDMQSDIGKWLQTIAEYGTYAAKEAGPETWNVGKAGVKGVGKALAGAAELVYPKNPMFPNAFGLAIPPEKRFSVDSEQLSKKLDALIPTDPSFLSSAAERAGKNLPREVAINTVFPGAGIARTALRTAAGGVLGEGAKALGAGEFLQGIAETTPHIAGDIARMGLRVAGRNAQYITNARHFGLNDQQTALVIENATKQSMFGRIAEKNRIQPLIEETQAVLGRAYDGVLNRYSTAASGHLTRAQGRDLHRSALGLRNHMVESEHRKLMQEVNHFLRPQRQTTQHLTGQNLGNLNKRINEITHGNERATNLIRPHLRTAEAQISPAFAEEFGSVNQLYENLMTTRNVLRPTVADTYLHWAETKGMFGAVTAALTGVSTLPAQALLLEKGVRRGATRLLTDPRAQQLGMKFQTAIMNNNLRLAYVLGKDLEKEVNNFDPSINMKAPTKEEIKEIFGTKEMQEQYKNEQYQKKIQEKKSRPGLLNRPGILNRQGLLDRQGS